MQGRLVRPAQFGYIVRLHRIHGPRTLELLTSLFRERGGTENLLLAVELTPPDWVEQVVVADESEPVTPDGQSDTAGPDEGDDNARPWRCQADIGSGHQPVVRPDGTSFCRTCHP